jgi:hypothetical protein
VKNTKIGVAELAMSPVRLVAFHLMDKRAKTHRFAIFIQINDLA